MKVAREVSVVIASVGPSRALEASVRGFAAEVGDCGEVVLATASRDGSAGRLARLSPVVRLLECRPGSLAPELWRDGLEYSDSELVAFSTGQMAPRRGWLAAMRSALEEGLAAGAGGPIAPGKDLSPADRALYLLRYANYLPPVPESPGFDPPGDNALYRRDRLVGLESSWQDGFWEIEVHRQMRARGDRLVSASDGVVDFLGGGSFAEALAHRLAHARRFGAGRSKGLGMPARIAIAAKAPAVPPLLLARIVANFRERNEPLARWLPALPHLAVLLATWAGGEAAGSLLDRERRTDEPNLVRPEVMASPL